MAQRTAVLGGAVYSYFRYQQHLAQENALAVHQDIAADFATHFGRYYDLVESFQLDDADYVLVMSNAFATKGKAAIQRLRARGIRADLLRLRVLRPFPAQTIAAALEERKAVAVIDQNLAPGLGGITYQEIAGVVCELSAAAIVERHWGTRGKRHLRGGVRGGLLRPPASRDRCPGADPCLLYTQPEQERRRTLLPIAGKEVAG
jgi:pyruvate ferredoxin oxidoreductase alpha subunit